MWLTSLIHRSFRSPIECVDLEGDSVDGLFSAVFIVLAGISAVDGVHWICSWKRRGRCVHGLGRIALSR